MDLCDIRVIREVLTRHGFHFSKALSQNFLTASWVPRRICEELSLDSGTGVLEIGPGMGALTQELCKYAGKVAALELDKRLPAVLSETLRGADNLTVVQGDVLKTDLRKFAETHLQSLVPIAAANLPYSVTAPALTALLDADVFSRIAVMVQREVAQRMTAAPGTPEYGSFSVYVQVKAEVRVLFDVPPDCFTPKPAVHSSVVMLMPHENPVVPENEQRMFFRVVKAAFGQRRKTLCNALCSGFQIDKEAMAGIISSCGIDPMTRGETLSIHRFRALASTLQDM